MKANKILLFAMLSGFAMMAAAQSSGESAVKQFSIQREVIPPLLQLVEGSVKFVDTDGNNVINANETCYIKMNIKNTGRGDAVGCVAQIRATGNTRGLQYSNQDLKTIKPGESQSISIPIKAFDDITTGSVQLRMMVDEPNGYGIDTIKMSVQTKAFEAPLLKIVDYTINGGKDTVIDKKMQFVVRVLMQNLHSTDAKNVSMQLVLPDNVTVVDGDEYLTYPLIKGGEQKTVDYQLIVSGKYTEPILPVQIALKESYGKYAESKTINLSVHDPGGTTIDGPDPTGGTTTTPIPPGTLGTSNRIEKVSIIKAFDIVPMASVLPAYQNEFGRMEMSERDDSFPYVLFRVKLQGVGSKFSLAKQTLRLDLGQMFQTEKTVTSHVNQILFLIPRGTRNVYITCGDGCTPQLIYSGQLESNTIYEGIVEIR